jgi:hypothetical protein
MDMSGLERRHYVLGFHTVSCTGGGQDRRVALFDSYASELFRVFRGEFDLPIREAWAEANEIVEGPDVEWAYRRPAGDSYHERLRVAEPVDTGSARSFYLARGSC